MLSPTTEDCEAAPELETPGGPSVNAHWDHSGWDDEENGHGSEEELEFTDAEEEDLEWGLHLRPGSSINSVFPTAASSEPSTSRLRAFDKNAFTVLMADRDEKEKAMDAKTEYRQGLNAKGLASEARNVNQFGTGAFLKHQPASKRAPANEDPDAGKSVLALSEEIKAALKAIDKKIRCKRKELQLKGQNLFRHETVRMFLRAQRTRKPEETRLFIAMEIVACCCGRGLYFARKVISWEIEWRKSQFHTINEGKKGCFAKTHSWFNDEGVQIHIREYFAGAGEHITAHGLAKSIGEYLDSQRVECAVTAAFETNPEDPHHLQLWER
ncbi:hypothetical protein BJ508DRAFT_333155 [Ascobolus immersus RN42]|uniref:Uncharacterized protein n=1 Tax=Ascobolus immersus RN42 TaxID=1160509 RepID=A0A3N4HKJ3_ASCIM|nr:hypothetical protein BJ508DRAFT_333155 [Ascobolus immersus RN42]